MNLDEFSQLLKNAPEEPINDDKRLEIIHNSYRKMSEGNNIDGSLNLIIVIEELSELQQELAKSNSQNYNVLKMTEELADVNIAIMYITNVCKIDSDELVYRIEQIPVRSITNAQTSVLYLAELQQALTKFLRGKSDSVDLLSKVARVVVAIEILQDVYEISDDELSKAIRIKLESQIRRKTMEVES